MIAPTAKLVLSLNVRSPFPLVPSFRNGLALKGSLRRAKQRRALDSSGPFLRNTFLTRRERLI
jgi:hypothetical protein